MANKKTSDTIEQQRKARQEFLELKKMQSGETAPPPKPSEDAVMPKTFGEKMQNFWFHFKWQTIAAVFSVIVIAFLAKQCSTRTEWDMKIVYFSYNPVLDSQLEPVADYFEKISKDLNGDGEVNINIVNCSMAVKQGNAQYMQTVYTKLQSMIAAEPTALLYITDEKSQEYFKVDALDGFFAKEQLALGDSFYSATKHEELGQLPEGLQIASRRINGTVFENKKNIDKVNKEVLRILEELEKKN